MTIAEVIKSFYDFIQIAVSEQGDPDDALRQFQDALGQLSTLKPTPSNLKLMFAQAKLKDATFRESFEIVVYEWILTHHAAIKPSGQAAVDWYQILRNLAQQARQAAEREEKRNEPAAAVAANPIHSSSSFKLESYDNQRGECETWWTRSRAMLQGMNIAPQCWSAIVLQALRDEAKMFFWQEHELRGA